MMSKDQSRINHDHGNYQQQDSEYYRHIWTKPVTKPSTWIQPSYYDSSVRYVNFYCEICNDRGVNSKEILLKCIYCNVVCHLSCIQKVLPQTKYDESNPDNNKWICFYCIDYLDDSRRLYETALKHSLNYNLYVKSQIIIAKNWRRYVARKFYIRIYQLILRLQIMFHVRRRKLVFLQKLQGKFRPIKLRIITCSDLLLSARERRKPGTAANPHGPGGNNGNLNIESANGHFKIREFTFYILVSVFDTTKGTVSQTWRFQTENISMNVTLQKKFSIHVEEKIILPGLSGYNILSLSLFYKENSGRDVFIGQANLDLSVNHTWKRGGHFNVPLLDQLYPIKDQIGIDMKFEDYYASNLFQHTIPLQPSTPSASSAAASGSANITGLMGNNTPRGLIEIDIKTFNGMTSECGYCQCTSAEEILRCTSKLPEFRGYIQPVKITGNGAKRPAALTGVVASSHSFQIPKKKAWIAIVEGYLYIYNHFGDQLKLIIDLSMFSHSLEYVGKVLHYKLTRPGYPDFQFHTLQDFDSLKWKCAFLCAVRYAKNKGTGDPVFDVTNLVVDLVAVQALKYQHGNRNTTAGNHTSIPGTPFTNKREKLGSSQSHRNSQQYPATAGHTGGIRSSQQLIRSSMAAEISLDWNKLVNCTKAILSSTTAMQALQGNSNNIATPSVYATGGTGRPMTRMSMINSSLAKIIDNSPFNDELMLEDDSNIIDRLHARSKAQHSDEIDSYYNKHSVSLPSIQPNNNNQQKPQNNYNHNSVGNNNTGNYQQQAFISKSRRRHSSAEQHRLRELLNLKDVLQEHYEQEEIIVKDKYQEVGERFIQQLYGNTAKEKAKELSKRHLHHTNTSAHYRRKSAEASNESRSSRIRNSLYNSERNESMEEFREKIRAEFDEFLD